MKDLALTNSSVGSADVERTHHLTYTSLVTQENTGRMLLCCAKIRICSIFTKTRYSFFSIVTVFIDRVYL